MSAHVDAPAVLVAEKPPQRFDPLELFEWANEGVFVWLLDGHRKNSTRVPLAIQKPAPSTGSQQNEK